MAGSGPAQPSGSAALPRPLTAAELDLLGRARQVLTGECMARHGFRWVLPDARPSGLPELPEFPFVVDDVQWARQHGYGSDIIQQRQKTRGADPNAQYLAALPADRRAAATVALRGPGPWGLEVRLPDGSRVSRSDKGCESEALRGLYSDLLGWFRGTRTVNTFPSLAYERMVRDPMLEGAVEAWARCMRAAGLAYPSPQALRTALGPDPPQAREVRFAVAEATCATGTPLGRTARQLNQRYLAQLTDQYRAEVVTLRRLQLAALSRAAAIIQRDQP
jgi:hypothetical protein